MPSIKPMHLILFAVFFALLAPTGAIGAPLLSAAKGLPVISEILSSDMGSHAALGVVFYLVTLYLFPMISASKFGAMEEEEFMEED
jgi:hypothetical protein